MARLDSPFSTIPNSEVERLVGEGFVEEAGKMYCELVRRVDAVGFGADGDGAAEVRLEIRGIRVGVSLSGVESGTSLLTWLATVPTDGEPAIVGSCARLRRDESDCFCIELIVCEVNREEADGVRAVVGVVGVEVFEKEDGFNRASL